jgi:predicted lysophospholipase L1 biosynthesis ABC-type transport system permease subunit
MTTQGIPASPSSRVWDAIENEKRRDRFLKRVSILAWTATFVLAALMTVVVGIGAAQFAKSAIAGQLPWMTVAGAMIPLFVALGGLSVLVATLSTLAMFFRLRTASLHEIQLRLAALEEMLAAQEK